MNKQILWKGKVWDYKDLPDEAKVRTIDWTDEQFDKRLMKLQEETYRKVSDEQFLYGPLRGTALTKDRERAKREYWRGVSTGMND